MYFPAETQRGFTALFQGRVTRYSKERGYGIVAVESVGEAFFHIKEGVGVRAGVYFPEIDGYPVYLRDRQVDIDEFGRELDSKIVEAAIKVDPVVGDTLLFVSLVEGKPAPDGTERYAAVTWLFEDEYRKATEKIRNRKQYRVVTTNILGEDDLFVGDMERMNAEHPRIEGKDSFAPASLKGLETKVTFFVLVDGEWDTCCDPRYRVNELYIGDAQEKAGAHAEFCASLGGVLEMA